MVFKIYNSLTKCKEIFKPLHPGQVRLYACGVTVYDYSHVGHARSLLFLDLLVRYLKTRGYQVRYVRNITDIDDKIIARAKQNNEDVKDFVRHQVETFYEEEAQLHVLAPDQQPRATDYIPDMIALIQRLIEQQYAYVADNGDVCFEVRHFKDYGKLSHRNIDELRSGARVAINEAKRDPLDFVLWKSARPDEPQWPSPWGPGRPGWHIECSAMAVKLLGQPFDIHCGGLDLKFPHHENEIAQSEAAFGKPLARYWVHHGLVQRQAVKMSKSVGNFLYLRDVLSAYDEEVLRFFFLTAHYRSAIDYSESQMQQAKETLQKFYLVLRECEIMDVPLDSEYSKNFFQAMDDDLNTPQALAVLFDLMSDIYRLKPEEAHKKNALSSELKRLANILGFLHHDPQVFLQAGLTNEIGIIEQLIEKREKYRQEKQWALADGVRDQLQAMGIVIEDKPEGTLWRRQ